MQRDDRPERDGWQAAATRPGRLDVTVVRAELARLRKRRALEDVSKRLHEEVYERFQLRPPPPAAGHP